MAYKGFSGSGTVGNFLSTTQLELQFPAARHAGRRATVEATVGQVTPYFCDGVSWNAEVTATTNPVTGGIELNAGQVEVSVPWSVASKTRGAVGDRCVGTVNTASFSLAATTYTWHLFCAIPADAIAVQIISLNGQAATVTGVTGAVSIGATKTELLNNAGTWVNATWAGVSSVTLPTATQAKPIFVLSDWIPITPATSTFSSSAGLPLQMCYARIATPSANASVSLGGYTASSAAWETIADNNVRGVRYQSGDFVATPASMTASSNPQNAPVVGVRYLTASSNVVNVMFLGDSLEFGTGPTIIGNSFGHIACNALSVGSKVVSCNNQGYPGQNTAAILARAIEVIPQFKPNIVVLPAFTPNDSFMGTVGNYNTQVYNLRRITEICLANGAVPILLQGLPKTTDATNVASSYTAPQDTYRKALNSLAAAGAVVYVAHGLGNGALPELFGSATYTADGTHPSDAGSAILASAVQSAITAAGF